MFLIISCSLAMCLGPTHPELPACTLCIYHNIFPSPSTLIFFFVILSPVSAVWWHVDGVH